MFGRLARPVSAANRKWSLIGAPLAPIITSARRSLPGNPRSSEIHRTGRSFLRERREFHSTNDPDLWEIHTNAICLIAAC
ncbi:hypothetical protein JYU34_014753 [Plutella xylostella]|uniref:Uncharacterized protein n=1 Tax=Plutella xylostella TaxID=51655 RepID=A0ABQ7Q945_PLUXY|nr:hypothetical protein JYU34_014753 [Plutella xylostella]